MFPDLKARTELGTPGSPLSHAWISAIRSLFGATAIPTLAIAHNGHITNYHQLRRRYEQRGIRFYTENDSEIIAIYLASQLSAGHSLEQCLCIHAERSGRLF